MSSARLLSDSLSVHINDEEKIPRYSANLNSVNLKLEYNINNGTGKIVENGEVLKNLNSRNAKKYDGINIYKLEINLVTPTGNVSVDIEFCSYDPKDGECKSRPSLIAIGAGLAGLIIVIATLLAFCCYRRRKIQVFTWT